MAVDYQIPPWVRGVSAGEIGQLTAGAQQRSLQASEAQARIIQEGQHMAQQFAMEQERLGQQQELAQMQAEVKQKQLQADSARESQQLEMTKAYHDQMTSLRQSELQQQQERVQSQTQQAAQKALAMQSFQQDLAEAGDDPLKQRRAVMKWGPQIGGMGGPMSTAMRESTQLQESPVKALDVEGAPGYFQVPSPSGRGYTVRRKVPGPDEIKKLSPAQAASLAEHLPELTGVFGKQWVDEVSPILKKRVQQGMSAAVEQAKSSAPQVPPVSQRKVGQVYETPKGPHEWTGKGWKKAEPAAVASEPDPSDDESDRE